MFENSNKKLFEYIQKIKKGKKIDYSNALISVAQRILRIKSPETKIDMEHKQALKSKLEIQLKMKDISQKESVLKRLFSFRPQNLIISGSLITVVCLMILLVNFYLPAQKEISELSPEQKFSEEIQPQEEISWEVGVPFNMSGGLREEERTDKIKIKNILLATTVLSILVLIVGIRNSMIKKKKM